MRGRKIILFFNEHYIIALLHLMHFVKFRIKLFRFQTILSDQFIGLLLFSLHDITASGPRQQVMEVQIQLLNWFLLEIVHLMILLRIKLWFRPLFANAVFSDHSYSISLRRSETAWWLLFNLLIWRVWPLSNFWKVLHFGNKHSFLGQLFFRESYWFIWKA